MISRMQIAEYVAARLVSGRRESIKSAAAWLVAHGKARQARYLAQDVAYLLSRDGYILAAVTTARPLSEAARGQVSKYVTQQLKARELEMQQHVDNQVVGGIKIGVPGQEYDATVKTKLLKFVEGAST